MAWLLPAAAQLRGRAARRARASARVAHGRGRAAGARRSGEERAPRWRACARWPRTCTPACAPRRWRRWACWASERSSSVVLAGLDDDVPEVREFAALAVGADRRRRGHRGAARGAAAARGAEVRFQAAAGRGRARCPSTRSPRLVPLLDDPDPRCAPRWWRRSRSLDEPHLAGHLARRARRRRRPTCGWRRRSALASSGDPRGEAHAAARPGAAANACPKWPTRLAALGCQQRARATGEDRRAPGSRRPHLRAAAGRRAGALGDARGVSALRRVLHGLRSDARSYAVELARELEAETWCPSWRRLAERPRGVDLFTLVEALASFASQLAERARAVLESWLHEASRTVRLRASWPGRPGQCAVSTSSAARAARQAAPKSGITGDTPRHKRAGCALDERAIRPYISRPRRA